MSCGRLTVQSEVLGERLRAEQLEALLGEVADRARVLIEISRCESLVGRVEEGEQFPLAHDLCDLLPLGVGGVAAGRIVRTRVQDDHRVLRRVLQVLAHAVKVDVLGDGVPVAVGVALLEAGRVEG